MKPYRTKNASVAPAMDAPEGMQEIFADRNDEYPVKYIPDVVYAKRGERELRLQMLIPSAYEINRVPEGRELRFPLVVFVQGSGWRRQDLYGNLPQVVDIARAGYVVASVEYRGSDEAPGPAYLLDIKTAVRFLKKEADRYHIDPERTAIWGNSSGAHGSILAALTCGVPELEPEDYPEQDENVQAVIDFYGPTDLMQIAGHPRAPFLMALPDEKQSESVMLGGTPAEKRELAELLNPVNYISREKNIPPFLILHGDEDEFVPFHQSVILYEALRNHGKQVSFYKVKGALHGNRMWNRKTVSLVREFLDAYV